MIQDMFYVPGARHGETYPISVDLWFELSMQASDSLSALRDASIRQTQKYAQNPYRRHGTADRGAGGCSSSRATFVRL